MGHRSMTRCQSDLGRAAAALAARGLWVFPLVDGARLPRKGSHGHLDATADREAVRRAWREHPQANIGVATGPSSRLWVLDIDPRHDGDRTLAELEARRGELPATVAVLTPGGGRHLWWHWPADGSEIRNSASRIGPGLDVRGNGGWVAAPPTRLRDGRAYAWAPDSGRQIVAAPPWLPELAAPQAPPPAPRIERRDPPKDCERYVGAAAAAELMALESAAEGSRNDTLNCAAYSLAGFVLAGALPEQWARSQLEARAVAAGLPAVEARRTIASAFRAAQPRNVPS